MRKARYPRTHTITFKCDRAMFWRISEDARDMGLSMSAYVYWQLLARLSNCESMGTDALGADIAGSIPDWRTEEWAKVVDNLADEE